MELEGLKNNVSLYMKTIVANVDTNSSLLEVVDRMVKSRTDIVVVRVDNKVAGVITSSDIFRAITNHRDFDKMKVKDIMATVKTNEFMTACELTGENPCLQVPDDCTIEDAMKVMARSNVHHLLVVGKEGQVVGTISSSEVMKGLKVVRW